MKKYNSYIEYILAQVNQTKEEYIEECKKCFLNEDKQIQNMLEEADTDVLIDELKKHNWTTTFEDYCKSIKYELMRRTDFEEEI